jgi:hypothetical protein
MPDPLSIKTGGAAASSSAGATSGEKAGKSRFEQVREAAAGRESAPAELPPQVTRVAAEQKRVLESQLRKRLEQTKAQSPQEFFRADMNKARTGVADLSRRVEALPKTSAFEPIRARFTAIEAKFRESGRLLQRVGSLDNPRELLKVQLHMYQLTQNIEVVTRVVEQVNTGVKQILQTQV